MIGLAILAPFALIALLAWLARRAWLRRARRDALSRALATPDRVGRWRAEAERIVGPAEAPNLGTPSEPRPAASVVLLRRGGKHTDRALEVLLLKRTEEAKFMPGVWVFPGGGVDPADGEGEAGYRACAVRELAEEAAIELPAGEELVLFSRWITPEVISTRFDAWFFLALAPAHTPPQADGVETVDAAWFEPQQGARRAGGGRAGPRLPDRQAARVAGRLRHADEALAAYRDARGRADPAQGRRHQGGPPGRAPGRPRLPGSRLALVGNGSSPACQGPGG